MVTVFSYIALLLSALVITLTCYLGLVPVTITGLFVTAYLQYRRGDQLNI